MIYPVGSGATDDAIMGLQQSIGLPCDARTKPPEQAWTYDRRTSRMRPVDPDFLQCDPPRDCAYYETKEWLEQVDGENAPSHPGSRD